tara:strand:+ start:1683 stop:2924 length:1242 start_codon:yes stop_codon:yes gene_type:complete
MNVDTNIDNYKINELIQLLDLEDVQDDDNFLTLVNEKTDKLINDCIIQGNSNLANFFLNVKQVFNNDNSEESKNIAKDETVVFNPANIVQRKTITKLLNIDSRFRNNYSTTKSSQFTIDLPQKIYNATELTLSDLEIPTTFYGFAAEYNNHYFWIKYTDSSSNDSYILIFLSDGNYYYADLLREFNDFLSNNSIPIIFNYDYDTSTGTITGTGKLTVSLDNSSANYDSGATFELNFKAPVHPEATESVIYTDATDYIYYDNTDSNKIDTKLGWKLGFRSDIYYYENTYTAEGVLDFSGPRYLFLYMNDFNQNANLNFYTSSRFGLLSENMIARISLSGSIFSLQHGGISLISEPRFYFGPVNLERLDIRIYDEHNRILNLNSMDISFSIKVKCLYDIPSQTMEEEKAAIQAVR